VRDGKSHDDIVAPRAWADPPNRAEEDPRLDANIRPSCARHRGFPQMK